MNQKLKDAISAAKARHDAQATEAKRIKRQIQAAFTVLDDCHIDVRTSKAEIMRIAARVVDAINLVDKE